MTFILGETTLKPRITVSLGCVSDRYTCRYTIIVLFALYTSFFAQQLMISLTQAVSLPRDPNNNNHRRVIRVASIIITILV